jgi:hypothetical protein
VKLYCLSGLGVDKRAFSNIKAQGVELVHIDWIKPLPDESLTSYSKRLFEVVNPEDGYNLMGVSFGGMIASEFSKLKQPNKLFLVSTINSSSEMSTIFKLGSTLRLHKLIPVFIMTKSNFITNYLFGAYENNDKQLLKQILKDTDTSFLKWAINAITKWKNSEKTIGIKIHGSNDKILPLKTKANHIINGGGHFMIVSRGNEISDLIEAEGA